MAAEVDLQELELQHGSRLSLRAKRRAGRGRKEKCSAAPTAMMSSIRHVCNGGDDDDDDGGGILADRFPSSIHGRTRSFPPSFHQSHPAPHRPPTLDPACMCLADGWLASSHPLKLAAQPSPRPRRSSSRNTPPQHHDDDPSLLRPRCRQPRAYLCGAITPNLRSRHAHLCDLPPRPAPARSLFPTGWRRRPKSKGRAAAVKSASRTYLRVFASRVRRGWAGRDARPHRTDDSKAPSPNSLSGPHCPLDHVRSRHSSPLAARHVLCLLSRPLLVARLAPPISSMLYVTLRRAACPRRGERAVPASKVLASGRAWAGGECSQESYRDLGTFPPASRPPRTLLAAKRAVHTYMIRRAAWSPFASGAAGRVATSPCGECSNGLTRHRRAHETLFYAV